MSAMDELAAAAFQPASGECFEAVPLSVIRPIIAAQEQTITQCEERIVELALELAAHITAEDRKRILQSEDVRSIMDLRLR